MSLDAVTSIHQESLADPVPLGQEPFLSDQSPSDKPWDTHKRDAVQVASILSHGQSEHQKQAWRMRACAQSLEFAWVLENAGDGVTRLKLKSARFCRVRQCPVCQWRRSLMWVARFYQAFPKIYEDHPEWRYILVSLTVRNCRVLDLRQTIKTMNDGWKRLIQRKAWPALGFVRSLEVTRAKDGLAHPHFHCLLAVPPGYLSGKNYLSTAKWAEMWREALRIDYTPICDARVVKPKPWTKLRLESPLGEREVRMDEIRSAVLNPESFNLEGGRSAYDELNEAIKPTQVEILLSAITEVIKYTTKPSDMIADPDWLRELVSQLRNSRAVAVGGELRKYLKDGDEENDQELIGQSAEEAQGEPVLFGWRERLERYQRKAS